MTKIKIAENWYDYHNQINNFKLELAISKHVISLDYNANNGISVSVPVMLNPAYVDFTTKTGASHYANAIDSLDDIVKWLTKIQHYFKNNPNATFEELMVLTKLNE